MKNRTILIILGTIILVLLGFLFFGNNKLAKVYHPDIKKEAIKPMVKTSPTSLPE